MDHFAQFVRPIGDPTDRLSERQKQCLDLVAKGHTSKEIGRILGIAPSTVDNHLNTALEKLGVTSRAAAARLLLSSEESPKQADSLAFGQMDENQKDQRTSSTSVHVKRSERILFSFPPLGGSKNILNQRLRFFHVFQIMFVGLMTFSAAIITIAGIIHLFSGLR